MKPCCRVTTPSQTAPTPRSTWPLSTGWCPTTPRSPATTTSPARARWWPTLPPPPTAVLSESTLVAWNVYGQFVWEHWFLHQKLKKICKKGKMYLILLDALLVWRRGKEASQAHLKEVQHKCVCTSQNLLLLALFWISLRKGKVRHKHVHASTPSMAQTRCQVEHFFSISECWILGFWSKTDISICGERWRRASNSQSDSRKFKMQRNV